MSKTKTPFPFMAGLSVCVLMLVFILIPFPASGLTIRFYFDEYDAYDEYTESGLELYYTTDENPVMGQQQRCAAIFDAKSKVASIKLSPELADHITQIRLDFPETDQVLSITNISVSSAGIIQHHYDPCEFFSENNILFMNGIPQMNMIESQKTTYIKTSRSDPYFVFSQELLVDMLQYRSSYRKTRFVACLLLVLGYASYRIGLFGSKKEAPADPLACR